MNTTKAAQALGRKGGLARAQKLNAEQRKESAAVAGRASAAKRKADKQSTTKETPTQNESN